MFTLQNLYVPETSSTASERKLSLLFVKCHFSMPHSIQLASLCDAIANAIDSEEIDQEC